MAKKPTKPTAHAAPIVGEPDGPGLCFDPDHPIALRIFCAAVAGITANPAFFGPIFQQSPTAAVEFANDVLRAYYQRIANDQSRESKRKP